MADNTQINDFFDLAAFAEQAQIIINESAKTAEKMREQFAKVGGGLNAEGLERYAAAAEKLQKTQRQAKQVISDFEKAHNKLTQSQGDYNRDLEQLDSLLQAEAKSTAAMAAQNKALEQIRKNLNTTDAKYAETVQKIIDKQNANIKVMKEFQNVEQRRTSGIGKYREAIEAALGATGNYRTQLMNIRNTMAEVEQAIMAAKEAHGEESEEVRSLQAEYEKLQQRAGKLQDAQNDMQARIKYLADDYGKFKAVLQGMQAALGIVSVFQSATAILGIHSNAVEKTTKNMAALIAMMQGLKQVQELLNKDNYFAQFLKNSPILSGAVGRLTKLFRGLLAALKAVGGYVAVLGGLFYGFAKTIKALRSNEFYEFNKTLSKTKDASERLALSQDFLQKQFGNTTLKVGALDDKLRGVAKSYNNIIRAIAETALADAMSTKLKELADAAVNLAAYEAQASKRLEKLRKDAERERKIAEQQSRSTTGSNVLGLSGGGAAYIGSQTIADFSRYNKVMDEIDAITNAMSEQRRAYNELVKEYRNIASISSEDLTQSMSIVLQGIDLSGLLAGIAEEAATSVSHTTERTGEFANSLQEVNEVMTKLATSSQLAALERSREYTAALAELQLQVEKGEISFEDFEEQLSQLSYDYQREELQAAISDLVELNWTLDENSEEYVRNAKEIEKLQRQLNDMTFENVKKGLEDTGEEVEEVTAKIETLQEKGEKVKDTIAEAFESLSSSIAAVSESIYEVAAARLSREEAEMAQHYELQRAYIEANVRDEEQRQQRLAQLALDEANAKAIAARKEAEVERRKAKVDLAITTAKASADVAAAIAAAVLAASAGDPYTLAVRIGAAVAAVIAAGAAVTSAAAKINSIPAYYKGGKPDKDTVFRAGERGYEVGIGDSGRTYLFPRDGVYVAPEPIRIHPHGESVQMVNNYNKAVTLRNSLTVKVIDNKRIEKYFAI